ncbi:hypothetical protein MWU58_11730 [Flavobacteriaceae bacterium S0825]|nr:hypothetical protein [Gaetbulibacter sp. S0825]MCK0109967.1 hypothetical protein [Flavobacteriaceae bacterium S0825]NIX65596.1 hypothetical protein [Gaetbulibacter sp. S0825]
MISSSIALYDWSNGVIMMAVFGLICLILIIVLISFMSSGKKDKNQE